jgi:hypothetical protein
VPVIQTHNDLRSLQQGYRLGDPNKTPLGPNGKQALIDSAKKRLTKTIEYKQDILSAVIDAKSAVRCPELAGPPCPPKGASLTLNCPASEPQGISIPVNGTLTPAAAGEVITIIYNTPNETITHTTTTDNSGNYKDSIGTYPSGTWTIQSSHGSTHSPICTVNVV